MLKRIDAAISSSIDLMFETTLASLGYVRKDPALAERGVHGPAMLSDALVTLGGHGTPEDTIRRRFAKSLRYLELHYKPVVNEWYIWDSLEGRFEPRQTWKDR